MTGYAVWDNIMIIMKIKVDFLLKLKLSSAAQSALCFSLSFREASPRWLTFYSVDAVWRRTGRCCSGNDCPGRLRLFFMTLGVLRFRIE